MEALLKRKLGREAKDYLAITFGLICYAIGWAAFLLPYQITTGGCLLYTSDAADD